VPAHVIRHNLIAGNVRCKYKLWSSLLCHFLRPNIASCHAAPHVCLNNKAELITPCVRCHLLYYFYDKSWNVYRYLSGKEFFLLFRKTAVFLRVYNQTTVTSLTSFRTVPHFCLIVMLYSVSWQIRSLSQSEFSTWWDLVFLSFSVSSIIFIS